MKRKQSKQQRKGSSKKRRTRRGGGGEKGGGGEERKLRQEGERVLDAVKKMASRTFTLGQGVSEGGIEFVPASDAGGGSSNLTGDVVFNLKGQPNLALTFLPEYQLQAEMELVVEVQQYTDVNYMVKEGEPRTEILCPERHGLLLSPSNSVTSLYNRVEVCYNGSYVDGLDSTSCGSANLLSKTGNLEASFNPVYSTSTPSFNRTADELKSGPGELSRLWPTNPRRDGNEAGYRTYRARIPRFPFRTLSHWQAARLTGAPRVGIVPPNTDLRVLLRREQRVPMIMQAFPLRQSHKAACSKTATLSGTNREWRRFVEVDQDKDKDRKSFYEVVSLETRIQRLYLVVKKLVLPAPHSDPRRTMLSWPRQTFSVYRAVIRELSKASSQVHLLNWDLPQAPATMFIMFLRESEVMGGGGGVGDTEEKLNKLLSTSADLHYRPINLTSLKLYDNTSPNNDSLVDNFALEGLNKAYPDRSLLRYMDHLRARQFLPAGTEAERFFNLPIILPKLDSDAHLTSPGNMAVYPVALDRGVRSSLWDRQHDANRTPLRLELNLSAPLDESESAWYLVVAFEHQGQALFEGGKYESCYTNWSWMK